MTGLTERQANGLRILESYAPRRWVALWVIPHGQTRRSLWRRGLIGYRRYQSGATLIGLTKAGRAANGQTEERK